MIPQISKREIGDVVIVDIKGELSGPWALKSKEALSQMIGRDERQKLVFNLQNMTGLDSLGVKSLFESVPSEREIGILFANSMVRDVLDHFLASRRFHTLSNEEELISRYGEALTLHKTETGTELRKSFRLQTALPVEFYCEEDGQKVEFKAIVTNLSKEGLFAEYIDLKVAEWSLEHIDPYDLKDLGIKLMLPKRQVLNLKGKVVHRRLDGEQVGIGVQFTEIGSKECTAIADFFISIGYKAE